MTMLAVQQHQNHSAPGFQEKPPIGDQASRELFTFKEAMAHLRVSRSTVYRLMWSGQLTGYKVGSTWRFYLSDVQRCVSPQKIQC